MKPNEQEVDSQYPNTLKCILECFKRLADYEDTGIMPEQIETMQGHNTALIAEVEQLTIDKNRISSESIMQQETIAKQSVEISTLKKALDILADFISGEFGTSKEETIQTAIKKAGEDG